MPEKTVWTDEKIVAAAKIICGVKDFAHVAKIQFMAKIIELDIQNQTLIRELYFARPNHEFFKNWTSKERKHFNLLKPPPPKGKSLWKSIFQAVRRSSKI